MHNQSHNTKFAQTHAVHTVIATGGETNGMYAVVAVTLPPHDPGTSLHAHQHHAEGCYVVDGTLALTHDKATIMLVGGASAFMLPGVSHAYWNPTAMPTTVLLVYRPGVSEAEALALVTTARDEHADS